MRTITAFLLLGAIHAKAQDTPVPNAKTVLVTNWVATTNWVQAPATYRMLNGKLHDANQPPWRTLTFEPTHYWNAAHGMYAPKQQYAGGGVSAAKHQPADLGPGVKVFSLGRRFQDGFSSVSVSNVPLTAADLYDGGAAGLSRTLNVRAYPVRVTTNMNGFKVVGTQGYYDYGVPYTKKVPVVAKKAVVTTNDANGAPKP